LAGGDLCREESGLSAARTTLSFALAGDKVSLGLSVVVVSTNDAPPFPPRSSNIHELCPVYGCVQQNTEKVLIDAF